MSSRDGRTDRSIRKARSAIDRTVVEIRQARIASGMSQRTLAERVDVSRSRISRIERDQEPRVPAELLARMAVFVGLDLSLRTYPGGAVMLDAPQHRLLGRLRLALGPCWRWRHEVGLPIPGDQRAWDAVATTSTGVVLHVEAETRIDDVQALLRRLDLKRRDGGARRMVLVVADTRHNRAVLRAAEGHLKAAFPADIRRARAALTDGRDPGADVLILL